MHWWHTVLYCVEQRTRTRSTHTQHTAHSQLAENRVVAARVATSQVIKALALGASAVLLGRPILWGLAWKGEAGVESGA